METNNNAPKQLIALEAWGELEKLKQSLNFWSISLDAIAKEATGASRIGFNSLWTDVCGMRACAATISDMVNTLRQPTPAADAEEEQVLERDPQKPLPRPPDLMLIIL